MRAFMFACVAYAATLTAHANADALTQTSDKEQSKGIGEDIAAVRQSLNTFTGDAKKEMNAIKASATQRMSEEDPRLTELVGQSTQGLAKTTADVQGFKEMASRTSENLRGQADDGLLKMNEEQVAIETLSQQTLQYIEDRVSDYSAEQKEVSYRNQAEFNEQLNQQSADTRAALEEQKDNIATATETMDSEFGNVMESIASTKAEDKGLFDEQKDMKKDIDDVGKELSNGIKSLEHLNTKANGRVMKLAESSGATIAATADKSEKEVVKVTKAVVKQDGKDVEGIGSQLKAAASAIADSTDDKADEIDKARKDVGRDMKSEAMGLRKDDAAASLEVSTLELDTVTALSLANNNAKDVETSRDDLNEEIRETLNDQVDEANQRLLSLEGDLGAKEQQERQAVEGATQEMKDEVIAHLNEGQAHVEAELGEHISTVSSKVGGSVAAIMKGIQAVTGEANQLGSQIGNDNQQIADYKRDMADNAQALADGTDKVEVQRNETVSRSLQDLQQVSENVGVANREGEEKLNEAVNRASKDTKDLAASVKQDLLGKVANLLVDASGSLSRSERSISTATDQGSDIIEGLKMAANSIEALKAKIDTHLPEAKISVAESFATMGGEVDHTTKELYNAKGASLAVVKEQQAEMKTTASGAINSAKTKMGKSLSESEEQLLETMEALGHSVEGLKTTGKSDQDESNAYVDEAGRNIEKALTQVNAINTADEKNNDEIAENLRAASQSVIMNVNAQAREANTMGQSALAAYKAAHEVSEKTAREKSEAGLESGKKSIAEFEKRSVALLGADMERTQGYMKENGGLYAALKQKVDDLDQELTVDTAGAQAKQSAADQKMTSLKQYEEDLEGKTLTAERAEQALLEKKKIDEREWMAKLVNGMTDVEMNQLRGMQTDAQARFEEERSRQQLLESKTNGEIAGVEDGLKAKLDGVDQATAAGGKHMIALRNGASEAEGELQAEKGAVDSAETIGQDAVKRSAQQEEKNMGSAMDGNLGLMEELLGAYQVAKGLAGSELEGMDEEFAKELEFYKTGGESKAAELRAEVARLTEGAPDYSALFHMDTADAAQEMAEADGRIVDAHKWSGDTIAGYDDRLSTVRGVREAMGTKIHNQTSVLKRTVVVQADTTVSQVEATQNLVKSSTDRMNRDLKDLKNSLQQLGGTTSSHDNEIVDQMYSKLATLRNRHDRMMDWQGNFRHRTGAWREAVENQMRKMGRDLGEEDSNEATAQLESEIGLNHAMRDTQMRVEDKMAANSGDATKGLGSVADALGNGVENSLNQEVKYDEDKSAAIAKSKEDMKRRQAENIAALTKLVEQQEQLNQNGDGLEKGAAVAGAEMGEMFKLPSLSTSDANMHTDKLYDEYNYRVMVMKSHPSLLEGTAKVVPTLRGSSFIETEDESEDADEIKVVEALNAELAGENTQLLEQNSRLGTKITKIQSKIKA